MSKFLDKKIYERAKKIVDERHKKHSAYKSMDLIKTYKKELGGKIDETKDKKGTNKWLKEKWINLTPYALGNVKNIKDSPKCGVKGKKQGKNPSICRPSKKVNKSTPQTAEKYTKKQLVKAVNIKKKGKTINWNEL